MVGLETEIEQVLQAPTEGRVSRSDETVELFYEFYGRTIVDGKWRWIVVKYFAGVAFVITTYLTDTIKAGETVWPKK